MHDFRGKLVYRSAFVKATTFIFIEFDALVVHNREASAGLLLSSVTRDSFPSTSTAFSGPGARYRDAIILLSVRPLSHSARAAVTFTVPGTRTSIACFLNSQKI